MFRLVQHEHGALMTNGIGVFEWGAVVAHDVCCLFFWGEDNIVVVQKHVPPPPFRSLSLPPSCRALK